MRFPSIDRPRHPLLDRLILIQITAIVCGFLLFYCAYQWGNRSWLETALAKTRSQVWNELQNHQEELRAWQVLGMSERLQEVFEEYRTKYPLKTLSIIKRSELPELDLNRAVFPAQPDGASDNAVYAEINTDLIAYSYRREGDIAYDFLIGLTLLFVGIIVYSFRYLQKKFYRPISQVNESFKAMQSGEPLLVSHIEASGEIREFIEALSQMYETAKKGERELVRHQLSRQVAHDIRSPLAVLEIVTPALTELPEQKRILILSAMARVRDIANSLLEQSRVFDPILPQPREQVALLSSVVDSLVTEKRAQFQSGSLVRIFWSPSLLSYGLFSKIPVTEFKRALSNLIDNATQAIAGRGEVKLELRPADQKVEMIIRDNGRGILPEHLPQVGNPGVSFGKANGHGLGVSHAKNLIEKLGGNLKIESEVGAGTSVTLILPRSPAPRWFVEQISLSAAMTILICDDDRLIHDLWTERLYPFLAGSPHLNLLHFFSADELYAWQRQAPKTATHRLYLCDYSLAENGETGIELLQRLDVVDQAILVTNHFEEQAIFDACESIGLRLLPKNTAGLVPIYLEKS